MSDLTILLIRIGMLLLIPGIYIGVELYYIINDDDDLLDD